MRRFSILAILIFTLVVSASAQNKKRVAVLDFEYSTVHSSSSAFFGTNYDLGRGIRDLVVEELVKGGVYSVIERAALDAVLNEQDFSNSNRANPASAAQIAQILGVDAIIIGSITKFGRDDKSQGIGGGGFGGFGRAVGGIGRKKAKAVAGITARIINTDTAEILGVSTQDGESQRSGITLGGGGGKGGTGGGGAIQNSSSNFAGTIVGEAVMAAVVPLARELETYDGRIVKKQRSIEGLVADYTEGIVILNVGSAAGLAIGDVLDVKRTVREVKDPATGKVLRKIETALGKVTITEVDETSAVGNFAGDTAPAVGDTVKNQ